MSFSVRALLVVAFKIILISTVLPAQRAEARQAWEAFAAYADDRGVITVATAMEGSLRHYEAHTPIITGALANYLRSPIAVDDGNNGVLLAALTPDWELVTVSDHVAIGSTPDECTTAALAAGPTAATLTMVRGGEHGITVQDWDMGTDMYGDIDCGLGEARRFAVTPIAVAAYRSIRLCVWAVDGEGRLWFVDPDSGQSQAEFRGHVEIEPGEWTLDTLADGSALVWTESGNVYVFPEDGSTPLSWTLRPGLRSVHGWWEDGKFVVVAATAREWTWKSCGGQSASGWEPFTDPVELVRASPGGAVSAITRTGTVQRLTVRR